MNNLVKALRIKRRMTQSELAYCCGVSRQTIISIEKGVFSPSLSLAYKLSRVLDFGMEDMYDFSPLDKEIRTLDDLYEECYNRKSLEKVMKRKVSVILGICILMLIALSSCSLDDLQGNLYLKSGLIDYKNSNLDGSKEIVENMKKANVDDAINVSDDSSSSSLNLAKVSGFEALEKALDENKDALGGFELEIEISKELAENIKKNGILQPMDSNTRSEDYKKLFGAFSGNIAPEEFSKFLSESASSEQNLAAKNSLSITSSLVGQLTENLADMPDEIADIVNGINESLKEKTQSDTALSKGEVLQVQVITNLVTSVASASSILNNEDYKDDIGALLKDEKLEDAMKDISLLSLMTNKVSDSVSLIPIPDISSLIDSFLNDSGDQGHEIDQENP